MELRRVLRNLFTGVWAVWDSTLIIPEDRRNSRQQSAPHMDQTLGLSSMRQPPKIEIRLLFQTCLNTAESDVGLYTKIPRSKLCTWTPTGPRPSRPCPTGVVGRGTAGVIRKPATFAYAALCCAGRGAPQSSRRTKGIGHRLHSEVYYMYPLSNRRPGRQQRCNQDACTC